MTNKSAQIEDDARFKRIWLGGLLTPMVAFVLAAGIMISLELGLKIGVWSGLVSAMPFLTILGAGVPALLAFAAILAGIILLVYSIGALIAHWAPWRSTQAQTELSETEPEFAQEPEILDNSFHRQLSSLGGSRSEIEVETPPPHIHKRHLSEPYESTVRIEDVIRPPTVPVKSSEYTR